MRTSAVSAMVMASVVVMALLMAPPLPTVDDPVATARAEYLVGAAAISVNQPVAAVLLAQAHGMEAPAPQRAAARSAMLSESEPMHTEDALTVLESATNPQVHFHGKQRVYVTDGEGAFHSYTVNVDHIHGAGSRLSVMEDDANEGAAWFIPEGQSPLETPAGWTFCDYAGLDQVAGRWAKVIEATNSDGAVVARWWVDAGRNVVLWTERYDGLGQPIMMFGFESIHYDKVARDVSGVETVVMGGASPGPEAEGRCASTRSCPMTLAGLPLVAYSSSSRDGTLRLVYSDGFRVASVLHTPGVMARAEERVFEPGMPDVLARQVDGTVISVATNGGVSVLTQAAAELPAAKPYEPSWWGQTSAGFQRMVGVR